MITSYKEFISEKMALKSWGSYIEIIANKYKELPDFDESVSWRWEALNRSNYTLWKRLLSKVKIIFTTSDESKVGKIEILGKSYDIIHSENSYETQEQMKRDYEENGRLFISIDYSDHPIFSLKDNIVFRAVHDFIVHILSNVDFSGKGEIAAFNAHSKLLPPVAIPAAFTEVVGQASYYLTFGEFPKQKIALIPGVDYKNIGKLKGYKVVNKELQLNERT